MAVSGMLSDQYLISNTSNFVLITLDFLTLLFIFLIYIVRCNFKQLLQRNSVHMSWFGKLPMVMMKLQR